MNRLLLIGVLVAIAGCRLEPLTEAQLTGADPDAAAASDRSEPAAPCQPRSTDGLFSGVVVDECRPGQFLTANVGLGGQHLCSFEGKGSFQFRNLPVGCPLTLTAAKDGYLLFHEQVVLPGPAVADYTISLRPRDGCAAPPPPRSTCRCEGPTCVPP